MACAVQVSVGNILEAGKARPDRVLRDQLHEVGAEQAEKRNS